MYSSTAGVVFLRTPHRRSDKTGLAEVAKNIAKVALRRPNEKLVRNLAEDSDVLERQRKSFASISERIKDAWGRTAQQHAAEGGHEAVVQLLNAYS